MTRHSKSVQIREFYSYDERSKFLGVGNQSNRLGADSMRSYDACCLCLQFAQQPMATPGGYLYCKECIYENIVEQKKAYARELAKFQEQEREEETKKSCLEQMTQNVNTEMFVERQTSILNTKSVEEIKRAKENAIEDAKNEGIEKQKMQSFWIPQNTPTYTKSKMEAPSSKLVDPMDKEIALKIKSLVECKFVEQRELQAARATVGEGATKSNITAGKYQCPSCCRTLTNSLKIAVLGKCGHVVCQQCVDKFTEGKPTVAASSSSSSPVEPTSEEPPKKKSKKDEGGQYSCIVCAEKSRSCDIIRMKSSGTGFCGALEDPSKQVATQVNNAMGTHATFHTHANNEACKRAPLRI
eukprot:NODE_3211_length_1257_cov_129.966490_g3048_i0.p1 GENE.NODE_3211_length_1257_cov_129.966490_g3048_i0~~NODE_3211_length_1257_cov_129.966490_g3048_i0.p1  ORF type:complete len:374 (-),score=80.35 NODE_3211_length_1257_cov_129.966490_g3048_i0:136-1200(-)